MKVSPLYNFLGLLVFHGMHLWFLDPCHVAVNLRQDCGYPGISGETCVKNGKFMLMLKDYKVLFVTLIRWVMASYPTVFAYMESDLPNAIGLVYASLGMYTAFSLTRCCYDSTFDGAPHCYH